MFWASYCLVFSLTDGQNLILCYRLYFIGFILLQVLTELKDGLIVTPEEKCQLPLENGKADSHPHTPESPGASTVASAETTPSKRTITRFIVHRRTSTPLPQPNNFNSRDKSSRQPSSGSDGCFDDAAKENSKAVHKEIM